MITSPLIGKRYARVIDLGPRNARTLLLLHGFAADASSWRTVSEALAGHYRVLAPDLPGHGGESDASSLDCTMEHAVERLARIMDFMGVGEVTAVGYSMGGRFALNFALAHPQRIEGLVLLSASPGLAQRSERESRVHADERLARLLETDGIEAFVDKWQAMPLFAHLERIAADRRAAVRHMRLRCSPQGLAASLRGMGTGVQPYLGDRLSELKTRTLILAGELDDKFQEAAERMHERIDGSKLAAVEAAGHVAHVEQPERFTEKLLAFLADEYTQAPSRAAAGATQ